VDEIRDTIVARRTAGVTGSIQDDEVCQEVASVPSVLVSLNLRDYADLAMIEDLVMRHGVSVALVRVPKAESGAGKRPAAIADIVHRHAHRIVLLHGDEAKIASVNRRGMRTRPAAEIVEQWQQGTAQ
jgi:hypothetical protein